MKKLILALALPALLTFQPLAHASGSFNCVDSTGLSVSAGISHGIGTMFGPLNIGYKNITQAAIPYAQVAQFWNHGDDLKALALDADLNDEILLLEVKNNWSTDSDYPGRGTLTLRVKTPYGKTITRDGVEVRCSYE